MMISFQVANVRIVRQRGGRDDVLFVLSAAQAKLAGINDGLSMKVPRGTARALVRKMGIPDDMIEEIDISASATPVKFSKPAGMTLSDVLRVFRFDEGHDYKKPKMVKGELVSIRGLGSNHNTIERLKAEMPNYKFTEISRRKDVENATDWVRVDIEKI